MESDPTRMCELLIGLPDINMLGIVEHDGGPLEIHVDSHTERACVGCGRAGWVKQRSQITLIDLPCFGRATQLVWHKLRLVCPNSACAMVSWTIEDSRIAAPRVRLTDRAARWVTLQVGRFGRAVNDVANELGCDWHTVNDAVIAYGEALVDDNDRIATTEALGLDETLFVKTGPFRTKHWCTSIVDVAAGRLLDLVPGRNAAEPCRWLAERGDQWRARIGWATLDMSGPYRATFDTMLPDAIQIADPFHVVKLANSRLDDVRRRVQQELFGHRGRKAGALYKARKLLVMAEERVIDHLNASTHARLALAKDASIAGLADLGDIDPAAALRERWIARTLNHQRLGDAVAELLELPFAGGPDRR